MVTELLKTEQLFELPYSSATRVSDNDNTRLKIWNCIVASENYTEGKINQLDGSDGKLYFTKTMG